MVKVNETIALKIVAVIAYLWIIPVIDSLDSYSYGMATRGLITSFISFVIGVLGGVKFLQYTTSKGSWVALIISSIVLMIFLVIYPLIYHLTDIGIHRNCALYRAIGFVLLGYGLQTGKISHRSLTFSQGCVILIGLYLVYNLILWGCHNPHPDRMFLSNLLDILYGLVRIGIVIMLWKTLTTVSVAKFLDKYSKVALFFAGLFWGMFFVIPADYYAPRWLAILMLFMAPVFAYVMAVIIRLCIWLLLSLMNRRVLDRSCFKEVAFWWNEEQDI